MGKSTVYNYVAIIYHGLKELNWVLAEQKSREFLVLLEQKILYLN